jgi:hypothetical protein
MSGVRFHPVNETAWKKNAYYVNSTIVRNADTWLALSRSKIDTMESYLPNKGQPGLLPVWVDLDTLIFDKSAVGHDIGGGRPWVHCYLRSNRTKCYGDIFSLDQNTIDDIRSMEQELIRNDQPLPHFDLQGYFGLLLEQNSSRLEIVQEHYPEFSFGFDCGGGLHPYPHLIKSQVKKRAEGGLECTISRTKTVGRAASISFTARSFSELLLEGAMSSSFDIIDDREAGKWLSDFYFSSSAEIK